jgi:hypothetical protein
MISAFGAVGDSTSVTGIKNPEDVGRRLAVTVWLKAVTNVHSDSDFIITVRSFLFSISSFTPAIHVAEEVARRGLGDICEFLMVKHKSALSEYSSSLPPESEASTVH